MTNITDLPYEIIDLVCQRARMFSMLTTCRRLYQLIVQTQYYIIVNDTHKIYDRIRGNDPIAIKTLNYLHKSIYSNIIKEIKIYNESSVHTSRINLYLSLDIICAYVVRKKPRHYHFHLLLDRTSALVNFNHPVSFYTCS